MGSDVKSPGLTQDGTKCGDNKVRALALPDSATPAQSPSPSPAVLPGAELRGGEPAGLPLRGRRQYLLREWGERGSGADIGLELGWDRDWAWSGAGLGQGLDWGWTGVEQG